MRHDLDGWIAAYLEGAGLTDAPKAAPLYRAGERRGSPLTERAMSPLAVQLMLKRRLKAAGLPEILSPHSFRVLVVTDLLSQNVPLEDVQRHDDGRENRDRSRPQPGRRLCRELDRGLGKGSPGNPPGGGRCAEDLRLRPRSEPAAGGTERATSRQERSLSDPTECSHPATASPTEEILAIPWSRFLEGPSPALRYP